MDGINDIQIRGNNGREEVLDPVRRRWVALTEEEWVRQHTIRILHQHYGYPLELMQVEGTITLNGLSRRCDIVVFRDGMPWLIVECKKPNVKLTQQVCDQACRYNTVLHVPYIILTNGHSTIVLRVDSSTGRLLQVPELPFF